MSTWNCEGVAGVNGVMAATSGGSLTGGYPVQQTTHLATHPLPEHTSNMAPQFAGNLFISYFYFTKLAQWFVMTV